MPKYEKGDEDMAHKYDIVLDGQLGQRFGTLIWTETDGNVSGRLSLLGFDNPVSGKCEGQRLELVHQLRTAVSTLSCRTCVELRGSELTGVVTCGHGCMNIRGKEKEGRTTSLGAYAEE